MSIQLNAQSWVNLKTTDDIKVFYKWKKDKQGDEELRIKLINNAKSDLNVDLEIAFYDAGVLDQSSQINTCLKKGFFSNVFRIWQVIQPEDDGSGTKLSTFELEVTQLKTEKVDQCEITEP